MGRFAKESKECRSQPDQSACLRTPKGCHRWQTGSHLESLVSLPFCFEVFECAPECSIAERLAHTVSVRRESIACHEGGNRLNKRQAQRHRAAAITVRRTNHGSVARCGFSAKTRQIWARTSRPKTAPVVRT